MTVSKMSEEFHEWLAKCPVNWYRVKVGEHYTEYAFENEEAIECGHLNYSDTMTGAVCNDCGAEEGCDGE